MTSLNQPLPPPPEYQKRPNNGLLKRVGRRNLAIAISAVIFAIGAGILAWQIIAGVGQDAFLVGTVAAFIPAPLLVGTFVWLGRHKGRPWMLLGFCFLWGACVATAISLGVNTGFAYLVRDAEAGAVLPAVISAPIIEEVTKFAGPLLVYFLARRYFNGFLDAIVYCGLSAAGFAIAENILYASGIYLQGTEMFDERAGLALVTNLVLFRGLVTMFAHPLFTGFIAIGMGVAAARRNRGSKNFFWMAGGVVAAMGLHALWNGSIFLLEALGYPEGWFGIYLGFMMPLFFTMVGFALWMRAREARRSELLLRPYVAAGWMSPPEVASLATYTRRSSARAWALRVAGSAGQKGMRQFQQVSDELADLRRRCRLGYRLDEQEESRLLTDLRQARSEYAGRDPYMPQATWDGRKYHVTFPDGEVRALAAPNDPVMPVPLAKPAEYSQPYA